MKFLTYQNLMKEEYTKIMSCSNWYLKLLPEIKFFVLDYHDNMNQFEDDIDKKVFLKKRKEFILFISNFLNQMKCNNQKLEGIFDNERKTIDTIVIHHSSLKSNTKVHLIETMHLLNLYVRDFVNPTKSYYGRPIFSGHIYNGKQTFFAYHYIIFPNGTYLRPLKDEYIGWHCGDWEYNCRSIAICFHEDLQEKYPSKKALNTARNIIRSYSVAQILGHREIKSTTSCPGNKFLGSNGWKQELLY